MVLTFLLLAVVTMIVAMTVLVVMPVILGRLLKFSFDREELDDRLGISEGFFIDIIDLLQSFGQSLLTEFTGLLMVVHDFVVEHREVQSESESNGVAGIETL